MVRIKLHDNKWTNKTKQKAIWIIINNAECTWPMVEPTADLSNIYLAWWDSCLYKKWLALIILYTNLSMRHFQLGYYFFLVVQNVSYFFYRLRRENQEIYFIARLILMVPFVIWHLHQGKQQYRYFIVNLNAIIFFLFFYISYIYITISCLFLCFLFL